MKSFKRYTAEEYENASESIYNILVAIGAKTVTTLTIFKSDK